jgi:hypothetical protein
MITIGCDPDTHTLALALLKGRRLVWWHVTSVPKKLSGDDAVVAVARDLAGSSLRGWAHDAPDAVVIEQMRVYPDTEIGASGINGLMRVASTGGVALSWLLSHFPSARYAMPTAPEWKGQVSKAAHHRQILAQVDDESRRTLEGIPARLRGHLLDAVGMALWAQGPGLARARARAKKAKG